MAQKNKYYFFDQQLRTKGAHKPRPKPKPSLTYLALSPSLFQLKAAPLLHFPSSSVQPEFCGNYNLSWNAGYLLEPLENLRRLTGEPQAVPHRSRQKNAEGQNRPSIQNRLQRSAR